MNQFEISFHARHKSKYRMRTEYAIDENGRREKVGFHIPSRIPPQPASVPPHHRQDFKVYAFAPGILCAIMPKVKASRLLKKHPFIKIHLRADDCWILLFDEKRLDDVAADMKLRRRKKMSPTAREKAIRNLRQTQKTHRMATVIST